MNTVDFIITGLGLFGLVFWIRGARRQSTGDCMLGLSVAAAGCALYFYLFSLTRTAWLPAIILGVFAASLLPFREAMRRAKGRAFAALALLLCVTSAITEHKLVWGGNALLVIEPYRTGRGWAFDAPRLGLRAEPFVQGIPEMIDRLATGIPGSDKQIRLIFSQQRFPGAQLELDRRQEQNGGNWYHSKQFQSDGWLCPALFRFFPRAPQHIYVKAEQA